MVKKCLWCDSMDFKVVAKRKDTINVIACLNCGLKQLECISPELLQVYMNDEYFDKKQKTDEIPLIGYVNYNDAPLYSFLWQYAFTRLVNKDPKGELLDIGCASGKFLELAELAGYSPIGIDVSQNAVTLSKLKGFSTFCCSIEQFISAEKKFDVITAWDVIEHIENPKEFLNKCKILLKPGGVLILSTPDSGSQIAQELGDEWAGYKSSLEHITFLDINFLNKAFQETFQSDAHIYSLTNGEYSTIIGFVRKGKSEEHDKLLDSYINDFKYPEDIQNNSDDVILLSILYILFKKNIDEVKKMIEKLGSIISTSNIIIIKSLIDITQGKFENASQLLYSTSIVNREDPLLIKMLIEALHQESINLKTSIGHAQKIIEEKNLEQYRLELKIKYQENLISELQENAKVQISLISQKNEEINKLREIVRQRDSSISWRLSQFYGRYFNIYHPFTRALSTIINKTILISSKSEGSIANNTKDEPLKIIKHYDNDLEIIIREYEGKIKGIIVYAPTVDWNIPLFQRPQQMALKLSELGYLFFYCTNNMVYDKVEGFQKISDKCFLTNQYALLMNLLPSFTILTSAHSLIAPEDILKIKNKAIILYEYLDEIHEDLTGKATIGNAMERHQFLMKNSDLAIVTADNLRDQVLKIKEKNVYLIPNGVDYAHFHIPRNHNDIPEDIKPIINAGKPIIGYYGAIAKWFDYNLIKYLAENRPDYNIVLIGWDYDGSLGAAGLKKFKNIHYLGIKNYVILPKYAIWFDIAIIPFILNKVTESTSPIKVFEYMALGKPIVTTDLRECQKYRSILIGKDHGDFLEKIDEAFKLKANAKYLDLLDSEARDNTWNKRAENISLYLNELKNENNRPLTINEP